MGMRFCGVAAAAVATLGLAGSVSGYGLEWTGGAGTTNYDTAGNWWSAHYGEAVAPYGGANLTISDSAAAANVVMSSGARSINDFSLQANTSAVGTSASFTMLSGAVLNVALNFDLGYFGGAETVTFVLNEGAELNVNGYFAGGRPGVQYSTINGLLNVGTFNIGGADFVNIGPTGTVIANGDIVSVLNNAWIPGGFVTTDAGYELAVLYDSNTDKTTISPVLVPEPASGAMLLIAAAGLMRRRR